MPDGMALVQEIYCRCQCHNFEIMTGKKLHVTLFPEFFSNGWSSIYTS